MHDKDSSNNISLISIACCLIAVGSAFSGFLGYFFNIAAIAMFLYVLVSEQRHRSVNQKIPQNDAR